MINNNEYIQQKAMSCAWTSMRILYVYKCGIMMCLATVWVVLNDI